MNEEAVRDYIKQAESVIESSPQMDEANTKAAVLRDFLDLLDWNIPKNTQLEYSVKAFGRTFRVDYALVLEGTPVAFLEAKGIDTPLTDAHREQVQEYMKSEDVNLGILTNAEEYVFFRRQIVDSKVTVNTLAETKLQDLTDRITILRAFTAEAIQNDEWMKILNRIRELRDARRELATSKEELATGLTTIVTENVSNEIAPHAESQAKEMIDRLIQDIEREITPDTTDSSARGQDSETVQTRKNWEPQPDQDAIAGTISRDSLSGPDDASVVVFPTKESGVDFLRENNAWGFVRIGRNPDYVVMYVSEDVQQVRYVAKVEKIISAPEAELARPPEAYFESGSDEAQAGFDPDKKVIVFEDDSLYELEDPIPFETKWLQSLRYTTLGELRNADTTDDIL